MYAAIDVGGTKTLVAVFTNNGEVKQEIKFPTPEKYDDFLTTLAATVAELEYDDFRAGAIAVPGVLDRKNGVALTLGNLEWKNEPIQADVEKIFKCPFIIENDAKLAGFSEALLLKDKYKKVLYVTISTGIGIGLTENGVIDMSVSDTGGHQLHLEYRGERTTWEKLASGSTMVKKYGKRASEINDQKTWKEISDRIAVGLVSLIALIQPEVIVLGGGVGSHFTKKFKPVLIPILKKYESPMMPIPPVVQAKRAETAVIYGCYELAKRTYGK